MATLTFLRFLKLFFAPVAFVASRAATRMPEVIEVNKGITRGSSTLGLGYASFKKEPFYHLNITCLGADLLDSESECGFACLETPSCFSYNVAAFPDINGKLLCELLPSDMYNNTEKLIPNKGHHHFSIASQCRSWPCKNKGKCVSLYEENSYVCICEDEFTGKNCETNVNECQSNPCLNNGTCLDLINGFRCSCPPGFVGNRCQTVGWSFTTNGSKGRYGVIQTFTVPKTARYQIKAFGARGGTHTYSYGYRPGTYYGGRGASMEGIFRLNTGTVLNIVAGQRGGNSVEVRGGLSTNLTAAQLNLSVEDNAGTGGGGGSFVYTTSNVLLLAAGGGGGASSGYNGSDGQSGTNGTSSVGSTTSQVRQGGTDGQPGKCNSVGASYHGGVGAGWLGHGCSRAGPSHGERGGSRAQGWVGGRAGGMNNGYNGGPSPGAVGGFGGGGGGSEDNGASGGGGGYSGGGSGTHDQQAGGGGGSYCSGTSCSGVTGGNSYDTGLVQIVIQELVDLG